MRTSALLVVAILCLAAPSFASDPLIVHEWGTFTSLQDEQGKTIGGINVDDEPLPGFVHDLLRGRRDPVASIYSKGLPGGARREITMRLETPVIYFYPPAGSPPQSIDVSVQFRGGLLSQFYPDAVTNLVSGNAFPIITDKTLGTLRWDGVRLGTRTAGPKTDSHVWLAPRNVAAADLTASNGESERYLFYRGVGHIEAPIVATQTAATASTPWSLALNVRPGAKLDFSKLWVCEFGDDGRCSAIELGPLHADGPGIRVDSLASSPRRALDLAGLRASMKQALIADGLFEDEAEAMLSTWKKSYFKSGGMRVFYVVPKSWTDEKLPLKLSSPAEVTRVMIGRLELLTPQQRRDLSKLAAIDNLPGQMAQAWDLYSSLGRFRSALLRSELTQRPTAGLRQFSNVYGI